MSQTEVTVPRSTGPVNTSQGWGVASAVVGLAIGFAAFAWYYHNKTYHHPTDPTWIQDADRKSAAGGTGGH